MAFFKILILLALLFNISFATRILSEQDTMLFKYHKGPLLSGNIAVNLIWYGKFNPSQKSIIVDFITSLQNSKTTYQSQAKPSIQSWWKITQMYSSSAKLKNTLPVNISLGKQFSDNSYSLGKSLTMQQVQLLATKGGRGPLNSINVVLTSSDVAVEGFCSTRCGTHGTVGSKLKSVYVWVGNSETQCPGQCAWPFHQPIYGPQGPPLVAPNNDVGLDGMVINLGGLLAGSVSNPFGNGFYQGPIGAQLEAASACAGIYGKGAYPGYAGDLLVDTTTGASYNVNGVNGKKYLVPALYHLSTKSCSILA